MVSLFSELALALRGVVAQSSSSPVINPAKGEQGLARVLLGGTENTWAGFFSCVWEEGGVLVTSTTVTNSHTSCVCFLTDFDARLCDFESGVLQRNNFSGKSEFSPPAGVYHVFHESLFLASNSSEVPPPTCVAGSQLLAGPRTAASLGSEHTLTATGDSGSAQSIQECVPPNIMQEEGGDVMDSGRVGVLPNKKEGRRIGAGDMNIKLEEDVLGSFPGGLFASSPSLSCTTAATSSQPDNVAASPLPPFPTVEFPTLTSAGSPSCSKGLEATTGATLHQAGYGATNRMFTLAGTMVERQGEITDFKCNFPKACNLGLALHIRLPDYFNTTHDALQSLNPCFFKGKLSHPTFPLFPGKVLRLCPALAPGQIVPTVFCKISSSCDSQCRVVLLCRDLGGRPLEPAEEEKWVARACHPGRPHAHTVEGGVFEGANDSSENERGEPVLATFFGPFLGPFFGRADEMRVRRGLLVCSIVTVLLLFIQKAWGRIIFSSFWAADFKSTHRSTFSLRAASSSTNLFLSFGLLSTHIFCSGVASATADGFEDRHLTTISVETSNLLSAYSSAVAGDTIVLLVGSTFVGALCTGKISGDSSLCVSKAISIKCSDPSTKCAFDGLSSKRIMYLSNVSTASVNLEGILFRKGVHVSNMVTCHRRIKQGALSNSPSAPPHAPVPRNF